MDLNSVKKVFENAGLIKNLLKVAGIGVGGYAAYGLGKGMFGSGASRPEMVRSPYADSETPGDYIEDTFTQGPGALGDLAEYGGDKVSEGLDYLDRYSAGFARPTIYGLGAGLGAYGLGRWIGNSKYLNEKFNSKGGSWEESMGKDVRHAFMKPQSKKYHDFYNRLVKEYGRKEADKIAENILDLAAREGDDRVMASELANKPIPELTEKYPGVFGSKGLGRTGAVEMQKERDLQARLDLEKSGQIPYELNPAVKALPKGGYDLLPPNEVFQDYHKNISGPALRDLFNSVYRDVPVKSFDKAGNPVYDVGTYDGSIKGFNPRSAYMKYLNRYYQVHADKDMKGKFGYDNIPKSHPYFKAFDENEHAKGLFPDKVMSHEEAREHLRRKFGLFGAESDQEVGMVSAMRALGARKLGANGQVKAQPYRDQAMFPWAKEVREQRFSDSDNRRIAGGGKDFEMTFNDLQGMGVPKYLQLGNKANLKQQTLPELYTPQGKTYQQATFGTRNLSGAPENEQYIKDIKGGYNPYAEPTYFMENERGYQIPYHKLKAAATNTRQLPFASWRDQYKNMGETMTKESRLLKQELGGLDAIRSLVPRNSNKYRTDADKVPFNNYVNALKGIAQHNANITNTIRGYFGGLNE